MRPSVCAAAICLLFAAPAFAGKPAKAKPDPAQPAAKTAPAEPAKPKAVQPLREDAVLAKLLAQIDQALKAAPPKDAQAPDPGGALLQVVARSALIAVLHGHFALAGQGQALRAGGMPAKEVAVTANTLAQNYDALGQSYNELAGQKPFAGELADIFRAVAGLCGHAKAASLALAAYADSPNDAQRAKAFEDALENYRGRLQALFATLDAGQPAPKGP